MENLKRVLFFFFHDIDDLCMELPITLLTIMVVYGIIVYLAELGFPWLCPKSPFIPLYSVLYTIIVGVGVGGPPLVPGVRDVHGGGWGAPSLVPGLHSGQYKVYLFNPTVDPTPSA